jgi:predicted helicase
MQLAGATASADNSIDPSARKKRGPQDDSTVFRAFAKAGQRLAEIHVHYEQQPECALTKTEKAERNSTTNAAASPTTQSGR